MTNQSNEQDDVIFESDEDLGDVAAAAQKVKHLRKELREAQAKRDEYLAGWQRCKADSINSKKDAVLSAERATAREKESFINDLLPVLDAFDMAFSSDAWQAVDERWQSGVSHIQNQLLDALGKHGIERFGKSNEKFDPRLHEAADEVEDGSGESHTILRVLRHGYRIGGSTVRPAHVIVRK